MTTLWTQSDMVSILVLMDVGLKLMKSFYNEEGLSVSILVLMDVGLKHI